MLLEMLTAWAVAKLAMLRAGDPTGPRPKAPKAGNPQNV